jgi:hypothetical protein
MLAKSPITKRQQVILVIRAASLEIVPSYKLARDEWVFLAHR